METTSEDKKKAAQKAKRKKYKQEYDSKPENIEKRRLYNLSNSSKNILYQKEYRKKNRDILIEKDRYRNTVTRTIYKKNYHKTYQKNLSREDKDFINTKRRKAYSENRNNVKCRKAEYQRIRRKIDVNFKLLMCLRSRIFGAITNKYGTKSKKSLELLGCSVDIVRKHLEHLFKEGMSWDNHSYHGWHIDHIIPCASFDLSDPEEQKKCFHYTNLQPLWALDNFKKGDKMVTI